MLAARGESLAAFDGRCIPAGCVAPRSHTPGMLGRRALPAGRLARLGATPDFHHGLLGLTIGERLRTIDGVRIAWFSPLPPARSGIAAYTAELLPSLETMHAIECFDASNAHDFVWKA